MQSGRKELHIFVKGLWAENAVVRQLLGMCPTLAVTNSALNGLSMGLATTFVLVASSCVVSLIRVFVPHQVRIATYTIIIATFVTLADLFLKAQFPSISNALGAYVPLIVVNCIILGRQEAFASKHTVGFAVLDAAGMGLGFCLSLFFLGSFRELLGNWSFLGHPLIPLPPLAIMTSAPGAFLALGCLIALVHCIDRQMQRGE